MFCAKNRAPCLQLEFSFDRLFKLVKSGFKMTKYFSHKRRLHFLLRLEYGGVLLLIFHVIVCLIALFSFVSALSKYIIFTECCWLSMFTALKWIDVVSVSRFEHIFS